MTDSQKEMIIKMRKEGVGYRSIANACGASRDAVRNLCKSQNLAGYAKRTNGCEETGGVADDIHCCLFCGAEIIQSGMGRKKKFCTEECRRIFWKQHKELIHRKETAIYTITCKHCGESFTSYGNSKRKYCCHDCYIKERFWTYEEEVERFGFSKRI